LLTATPPRCSEFLMPGLGKTAAVPGSAGVSLARSQAIYRRYAVALYRQALLNLGAPVAAGHVACDALVNECALAAIPERGTGAARYRRAESVFRRSRQLAAGPGLGTSTSRAAIADPRKQEETDAGSWIRHGNHPGRRRDRAWGAGGQGAAGDAAVRSDEENVTRVGRTPGGVQARW
jgi:hypothetical protein